MFGVGNINEACRTNNLLLGKKDVIGVTTCGQQKQEVALFQVASTYF